ncbi:unnamed protein product [Cuscuta campestris]|uniref:Uncharacterized protein n=1 Tax=Cuscuta campestris TaxID=132261 RepID=A0A484KSP2_9ASTE|nr:unnamed protein product [Cuscuta campestris]
MAKLDSDIHVVDTDKTFARFCTESKQLDPERHQKYIYGGCVGAYVKVSWHISVHCYFPTNMMCVIILKEFLF